MGIITMTTLYNMVLMRIVNVTQIGSLWEVHIVKSFQIQSVLDIFSYLAWHVSCSRFVVTCDSQTTLEHARPCVSVCQINSKMKHSQRVSRMTRAPSTGWLSCSRTLRPCLLLEELDKVTILAFHWCWNHLILDSDWLRLRFSHSWFWLVEKLNTNHWLVAGGAGGSLKAGQGQAKLSQPVAWRWLEENFCRQW